MRAQTRNAPINKLGSREDAVAGALEARAAAPADEVAEASEARIDVEEASARVLRDGDHEAALREAGGEGRVVARADDGVRHEDEERAPAALRAHGAAALVAAEVQRHAHLERYGRGKRHRHAAVLHLRLHRAHAPLPGPQGARERQQEAEEQERGVHGGQVAAAEGVPEGYGAGQAGWGARALCYLLCTGATQVRLDIQSWNITLREQNGFRDLLKDGEWRGRIRSLTFAVSQRDMLIYEKAFWNKRGGGVASVIGGMGKLAGPSVTMRWDSTTCNCHETGALS